MISFIVTAYKEAQSLAATVDTLQQAGQALCEPHGIIVSDDGSTDQTSAVAIQHGAAVITATHRQIAATRNSGAKISTGDLLIFVDADTLVNAELVRAAIDAMRSGAVGGDAGMLFDELAPLFARLALRVIVRVLRSVGPATGCFLFCTRSVFVAVGGFDKNYYGAEEIVMSRALRRQGRFVVLKHAVTTSARKLRTYSLGETMMFMTRMALRGTKAWKQRQGVKFWYADRRKDQRGDK